jgi:hypothetical protein
MPVPLNTTPKNPFSFVDTWLIAHALECVGYLSDKIRDRKGNGETPEPFCPSVVHIDMRARVWPLWRFHRVR